MQLQAENESLKDKIKIFTLELSFAQNRLESGKIERDLAVERLKQKLTEIEIEKQKLHFECERLGSLLDKNKLCKDLRTTKSSPIAFEHPNYEVNSRLHLQIDYQTQSRESKDFTLTTSDGNEIHQKRVIFRADNIGQDRCGSPQGRKHTSVRKKKRKIEAFTEKKVEPRVVRESLPLLEKFDGINKRVGSRLPNGIKSKKMLILSALEALGGEGTVSDVDKWVMQKYPKEYVIKCVDRKSISNTLSTQVRQKKLDAVKRNKGSRLYQIKKPARASTQIIRKDGEE